MVAEEKEAALASGSDDKTVRVWSAATGECVATLRGHSDGVRSVAWSGTDGDRLASGSVDKTVQVYFGQINKKPISKKSRIN